jgi:hypothetical protein
MSKTVKKTGPARVFCHQSFSVFQSKSEKHPGRAYVGTPDGGFACWEDEYEKVLEFRKAVLYAALKKYDDLVKEGSQKYGF